MREPTFLRIRGPLLAVVFGLASGLPAFAQNPDAAAEMMLTSARKAFNDKNLPFAATRFREFLQKYGGHKEATSARYGLALALLDGPEKDRNQTEIQQLLTNVIGDKNFADRPYATYYLGHSYRAQGMSLMSAAEHTHPADATQKRAAARALFEQAATTFAQALALLEPMAKDAGEKELPESFEGVARSRCDAAEMLLRLGKLKEAQKSAEPLVKDPVLSRSRYRDLGRYYFGQAAFLLNDIPTAQKTLTMLAPFAQPEFGTHARYLLARTQHLSDELTDARVNYDSVVADYKKMVEETKILLKQPQRFNNDPAVRDRLEKIVKGPAPDHVARSSFYLGVLIYEAGRFAEAKTRFADFVKQFPDSPLKGEAEIRIGYCQVQGKEYAEALKTLQPIANDPKVADQALLWIGKAVAGAAPDPVTKPAEHKQSITQALSFLRQAAARAQALGDNVPDAKTRRGEIMLEIADQQQALGENRPAALTYQALLTDKSLPDREEEISLRYAQALHLAKDYDASDAACKAFEQKFPKSTLLPASAFTFAENAYFRAMHAEKTLAIAEKVKQLPVLYGETIKRTQAVIDKYPEYPKILLARHALGLTYYRLNELDKAVKAWNDIPGPERSGELAIVNLMIADCILRQTPTVVADDALAVGKLEEQVKTAAELLEAFIGANPKDANTPDALLKLGLCHQRLASILAQPPEKLKAIVAARAVYDRLTRDFGEHPLKPNAYHERAKVIAMQGDIGGAINDLRRFQRDPYRTAKVAPMATITLATLLRATGNPAEAADLLQKVRDQHEKEMTADPQRAAWVSLVKFHQGVALREAGKLAEAKALLQSVVAHTPNRPEAVEAMLRIGQCMKDEGLQKIDQARKSGKKPEEAAPIYAEGYKMVQDATTYLEGHSNSTKNLEGMQEVRARMLYEAAWGSRIVADPQVRDARKAAVAEMVKKLGAGAAKLPPPEVPLDKIPLQPAEKHARGLYKSLIDQFGDVPLAVDARLELAELLAQRSEYDAAQSLLSEALDKEPNVDLTEKIRLRLGTIHAAKGNLKGALAQFEAVAANPKSSLHGWAQYRAAEVYLQNKEYGEAVKRLVMFRDNGKYQNIPELTDRALLRLGHAYAHVKAWTESIQVLERMVGQFGGSPWVDEARYGIGWARQQQNDWDGAANWYGQVVGRSATELAARSQYQIGVCRMRQKRFKDAANAFMVVPTTYDYPELSAAALLEAAEAYRESDQRDQARRLWERVTREYAGTPFAELAKERLDGN
jgi:TolA-binding protein